jgi:hypothetical protein
MIIPSQNFEEGHVFFADPELRFLFQLISILPCAMNQVEIENCIL